jgi:hypothetical protein
MIFSFAHCVDNGLVDHGGFQMLAEMNWSWCSLRIPAVYCMVSWPSFTVIWIYAHRIECWSLLLLFPVLWTIFKCASSVIFVVDALAALQWTRWCLHPCCVPESEVLGVTPTDSPGSVPFSPGWGVCVAMIHWCWIREEDDNEKKWEVLRNIYLTTSQNEINNCQAPCFTQVESCCIWLQIAGVSNHSTIWN